MGVGEGVGVGGGVGVAVGLAVGEGAGVDVGTAVKVGSGVLADAGVSVGTAAAIRGARGGGSGESSLSATAIAPTAIIATIIPTTHQRHPPNLDDPPELASAPCDSERGGAPDERDSERGSLYEEDERRPPPSLHEWQVHAGGWPP